MAKQYKLYRHAVDIHSNTSADVERLLNSLDEHNPTVQQNQLQVGRQQQEIIRKPSKIIINGETAPTGSMNIGMSFFQWLFLTNATKIKGHASYKLSTKI
jgi:hypothetical protein